MGNLNNYIQLVSNMGWRYIAYRITHELKKRSGLLKRSFPINPVQKQFLNLAEWKSSSKPFFFQSGENLSFNKDPNKKLKEACHRILNGELQFFSYQYIKLGSDYDWITNPDTGYRYDITKHWTEINDYSKEAGDIKYVWEKSRFSYLYTIIRYDYHFNQDNSKFVFNEIENWMDANPINRGPNYKCSQEISLRILNWIFALYFYKNSSSLNESLFQRIMHYIYWQLHHVYNNIDFSRIAVRNNHAITETLTLYIVSTLFPQLPESSKWKEAGKKWFEQEIAYQIYDDGTFLQFSMNYHRVVIQLLTWGIAIAHLNHEEFKPVVYEKAYKSINFLYQCQEEKNGYLPNYGANDGALFFKLSDNDYRDYRPQLDALHKILTNDRLYALYPEDSEWFNFKGHLSFPSIKKEYGIIQFRDSGYCLIRKEDSLTFIKNTRYKNRPTQADNMHIDIWYKGENTLLDCGSYKYNTQDKYLKYFRGTESHNTIMLGEYDQMLRGDRFIWYYWSQAIYTETKETKDYYEFEGELSCYKYISKNIVHKRNVKIYKQKNQWEITDELLNKPKSSIMRQLWHLDNKTAVIFDSTAQQRDEKGFNSSFYGQKQDILQKEFISSSDFIKTIINLK